MGFEAHEMKVHTISFDFMILLSFIVHCDSEPTGYTAVNDKIIQRTLCKLFSSDLIFRIR